LVLQEGNESSAFNKTVYFESNQRSIDPRIVSVTRQSSTSYAFNITMQFLRGELITLYTSWTARGQSVGSYNLSISAFSNDPYVDPRFRSCQDTIEAQIVEGVPVINEPAISPVYHPSGLDPQKMYVYPSQDLVVKCNISCPVGIKNVTLYYSIEPNQFWNQTIMTENPESEWTGTVPGQPEGKSIALYVEALSLTEQSSRTKEYVCTALDYGVLELRTEIATAATVAVILVFCAVFFCLRRRRVTQDKSD
jgi:hypothetical protein